MNMKTLPHLLTIIAKNRILLLLLSLLIASTSFTLPVQAKDSVEDKAREFSGYDEYLNFTSYVSDGLIPVFVKGKWGYIDTNGKMIISPQFSWAGPFMHGLALVQKDGKNSVINKKGQQPFAINGFEIKGHFYYGAALAQDTKTKKFGYINTQGKWIIPAQYDETQYYYQDNSVFLKKKDGKWGLADLSTGQMLTSFVYDEIPYFTDYDSGQIEVRQGEKWGTINHKGKVVIPIKYDEKLSFNKGEYAAFKRRDSDDLRTIRGIIDRNGKEMENDWIFTPIEIYADLQAIRVYEPFGSSNQTLVSFDGETLIPYGKHKISVSSDGSVLVQKDKTVQYYDLDNQLLFNQSFEDGSLFQEGIAAVKKGGKWGYIDLKGNWVIKPAYEEAKPFLKGTAVVKQGGKYGVIDTKGKPIIALAYDEVEPLTSSESWVYNEQFDFKEDFTKNRVFRVSKNRKWGLFDQQGKELIPLKYVNIYNDAVFKDSLYSVLLSRHDDLDTEVAYIDASKNPYYRYKAVDVRNGRLIFPKYDNVFYLGEGLYSGVPEDSYDGSYVIMNQQGKVIFKNKS